jgi:tRNA pseudouridine38-40 synthase
VRRVQAVPKSFHPRFSARWRAYRYRIVEAPAEVAGDGVNRSPLTDRFAWYVRYGLDLPAMQSAADQLLGEHDFASFGQPTQGESTVRRVTEASWQVEERSLEPLDMYPGQGLVFTITANGFLRQMVRTITGTLIMIGQRKRPPDEIVRLLRARDRGLSAPPAPASGLTLERVEYAGDAGFTV